ncbi:TetR/AcrR family transcriptional regulator [Actinomadura rudentiformis]|uniref:TetR/AcrR family transcriptional regulator n=1 Tax=Actinomadura rudentiformis TaxID=359158 RepID=A0A6H9Z3Q5_9ACTN|nr:TetR/AcrR family transcriptional regulator [Actinomadura rudentiformis]KAB2347980.1 TetR/AcrR family transcriptional regulator [Actinomadura rudentiformis]
MGNREKLLKAARDCLHEKGYRRTTARDLTTAAGVSLAAIGYHFGSTEALLNAALHEAVQEWGERLECALAAGADAGASPAERFAAIWTQIISSFETDRPLWAAQAEVLVQAQHVAELRAPLTASMAEGRSGLAEVFLPPKAEGNIDDTRARLVGSLCQTLLTGLVMQWLIDPHQALSANELASALHILAEELA